MKNIRIKYGESKKSPTEVKFESVQVSAEISADLDEGEKHELAFRAIKQEVKRQIALELGK